MLDPVQLHLEDGPTAMLRVGADLTDGGGGRWLRMRVRTDVDAIHLLVSPSEFSRSWRRLPTESSDPFVVVVAEVISIGPFALRLPMIVGAPTSSTSRIGDGAPYYEGILGLGINSPLWTHWDRFTLCADTLTLGVFDMNVPRVNAHAGVAAHFVPSWMYTLASVDALGFQLPTTAHLNHADAARVRHACLTKQHRAAALESVARDISTLRRTDPLVGALLDGARDQFDADNCALASNNTYTVLVLPRAEYNVIPPQLMHTTGTLRFRANSSLQDSALRFLCDHMTATATCAFGTSHGVSLPLLAVSADEYTSAAPGAIASVAARMAQLDGSTIILGAPALRRLVWMQDLATGIGFVASPYDYGMQMHMYNSLLAIVPLVLWAVWAIVAHPTLASTEMSVHAARDALKPRTVAAAQLTPDTIMLAFEPARTSRPVQAPRNNSSEDTVVVRRVQFGAPRAVTTTTTTTASSPPHKADDDDDHTKRLQAVEQFALNAAHWLLATHLVRPSWTTRTARTLPVMRAFTDAAVTLLLLLALVYLDVVRFVSHMLDDDSGDMAVARLAVYSLVALAGACAVAAQYTSSTQPRTSNLLQQLEVLIAAWLLAVPLQSRTPSLLLVVLLGEVILLVAVTLAMRVYETSTKTLADCIAGALLLAGLSVFCVALNWRVLIDRMWDDHPLDFLMATLACALTTVPLALVSHVYETTYARRVLIARFIAMGINGNAKKNKKKTTRSGG